MIYSTVLFVPSDGSVGVVLVGGWVGDGLWMVVVGGWVVVRVVVLCAMLLLEQFTSETKYYNLEN